MISAARNDSESFSSSFLPSSCSETIYEGFTIVSVSKILIVSVYWLSHSSLLIFSNIFSNLLCILSSFKLTVFFISISIFWSISIASDYSLFKDYSIGLFTSSFNSSTKSLCSFSVSSSLSLWKLNYTSLIILISLSSSTFKNSFLISSTYFSQSLASFYFKSLSEIDLSIFSLWLNFIWYPSIEAVRLSIVIGSLQVGHSLLLAIHLFRQFKWHTCPHLSNLPFSILNWQTMQVVSFSCSSIYSQVSSGRALILLDIEILVYRVMKIFTISNAD